jgi:hypothetical protein
VRLGLVALILVLLLAGVGSWLLADHLTGGSGQAQDAAALIDRSCAAMSQNDATALRSLYTSGAVLTRDDGDVTVGATAISRLASLTAAMHFRIWRVAPVTVEGNLATTFMRYTSAARGGTELGVFQFTGGKIVRQWIFRIGTTPPFDNALTP